MSEIEKAERMDAAKTQEWINMRFLIKGEDGLNAL
jgi:hypothetical protein